MSDVYSKYGGHFTRETFSDNFKSHPRDPKVHVKYDEINTYVLNENGYRGKEFDKNEELVVAGCSFTFGSGVAEDKSWGSLVAKELGSPVANLGVCAWSTHATVENIFSYFKKYGHPKKLLCLFPDASRIVMPTVKGLFEYEADTQEDRQIVNMILTRREDYDYSDKPKYSKRPYMIDDILPHETILYFYMRYVRMLEDYCNAVGIEFLWSTWDRPLSEYLESSIDNVQPAYKMYNLTNYCPMGASDWSWDTSVDGGGMSSDSLERTKKAYTGCHAELEASDGDNFYIGTDLEGFVHWGTHKHAHIAERFLQAIRDRQPLA